MNCKSALLRHEPQRDRILNLLDTPLRDAEIQGFWEGLAFSSLKYSEKLQIIVSHYNTTIETVKRIVHQV